MEKLKSTNFLTRTKSYSHSQVKYCCRENTNKVFNNVYENYSDFDKILELVKAQIDFDSFRDCLEETESVCMIIAEVFSLPDNKFIRIAGNDIPVYTVQSIYKRLCHEHIKIVCENFKRAAYEIKHKKTYIRTALYNCVLEYGMHYTNAVNKDLPQFIKNPFDIRKGANR